MIAETVERETPRGRKVRLLCRQGTSDDSIARLILTLDEYRLAKLPPLEGVAIDVGAHIGTVTIALALDNPRLTVVALEPVPESRAILAANVALNELDDRVTVLAVAATAGFEDTATIPYGWPGRHAYIGGLGEGEPSERVDVPAMSLEHLTDLYGRIALLKSDCEGCEWGFLRSRHQLTKVDRLALEFHGGDPDRIRDLLDATHDVEIDGSLAFATLTQLQ